MGELLNKNYMAKNLENGGILGKKNYPESYISLDNFFHI
jgi:hypothetical protein